MKILCPEENVKIQVNRKRSGAIGAPPSLICERLVAGVLCLADVRALADADFRLAVDFVFEQGLDFGLVYLAFVAPWLG
jgi:hypothetical protein